MSAAREALNWPHGDFAVHDPSPDDDHSAIYLICPGGLMVNTSGDPTPGLDAKRTAWMAENLNAALALPSPRSPEPNEADREMIEGLRELLEKATPGPLEYAPGSVTNWHDHTFEMEWIPNGQEAEDGVTNSRYEADGRLWVAAVNALPRLLALAERNLGEKGKADE